MFARSKPLRALLINANKQIVEEILDYGKKKFQSQVKTFTTRTESDDGFWQIIFDTDMFPKENNPGFVLNGFDAVLFGNVIITGQQPATGKRMSLDSAFTSETLEIIFLDENLTEISTANAKDQQQKGAAKAAPDLNYI